MDPSSGPELTVEGEREATRLWRTWKTVLEMLKDRVCACEEMFVFEGAALTCRSRAMRSRTERFKSRGTSGRTSFAIVQVAYPSKLMPTVPAIAPNRHSSLQS